MGGKHVVLKSEGGVVCDKNSRMTQTTQGGGKREAIIRVVEGGGGGGEKKPKPRGGLDRRTEQEMCLVINRRGQIKKRSGKEKGGKGVGGKETRKKQRKQK